MSLETDNDEAEEEDDEETADSDAQTRSGGRFGGQGRTIAGGNAPRPIPTTSAIPSVGGSSGSRGAATSGQKKKGVATLGDIGSGHTGHGHDDDDDDEDDNDRRKLFAGGEKSGLAVQEPGNQGEELRRKIIEKALK